MAERNFKATISVGARLGASFNSTFTGAEARANGLAETVKRLNKTQKTGTLFEKQTSESDAARQELLKQARMLAALKKWEAYNGRSKETVAAINEQRNAVERASDAYKKKRARLVETRKELQAAGIDTARFADEMKRVSAEAAQAEAKLKAMGAQKAAIAGLHEQFGKLKSSAIAAGAAVTALGVGIWKTASGMANMGDDAAETSAALGMTSQELQAFRYAGERVGVTSEKMDVALNKFNQSLEDARNGTGKTREALDELGLYAESLQAMSASERMATLAEAFKNYSGSVPKSALATELFGAKAYKMANVLSLGADGLKKLRKEGEKTGFILDKRQIELADEFDAAFGRFKATLIGIRNEIGTALLPIINKFLTFAVEHSTLLKVGVLGFAAALSVTAVLATAKFGLELWRTAKAIDVVIAKMLVLKTLEGGGVAATVGKIGGSLSGALPGLSALATRVLPLLATGFRAVGAAIMGIPGIGWIIAGITAISWAVWKYWEPIKAFFGGMWDGLTSGLRAAWDKLQPMIAPIVDGIRTLWKPVSLVFEPVVWVVKKVGDLFSWLTTKVSGTKEEMSGVANMGRAVGQMMAQSIAIPLRAIAGVLASVVNGFGALKDILTGNWGNLGNRFKAQLNINRQMIGMEPKPTEGTDAQAQQTKAASTPKFPAAPPPVFFGESTNDPASVTPAREPVPAFPNPLPARPGKQAAANVSNAYNVTVNAQPGQDGNAIAQQVLRELESRERDRHRTALYDAVPAY